MKKLDARDIKDLNLLKHYRIIRRWASRNNDLKDADMEVAELTRLLKEAIERRDQLIEYAPAQSWYQYFIELAIGCPNLSSIICRCSYNIY